MRRSATPPAGERPVFRPAEHRMRILLVGHGRMGALVERLAPSYDCEVAGIVDERSSARAIEQGDFGLVDVAIDFSLADAVPSNFPQLAARRISVVIGTTGWQANEARLKDIAAK